MKKILILIEKTRYAIALNNILSDAIEYGVESDVLEKWLDSCYENHIIRLTKIVN